MSDCLQLSFDALFFSFRRIGHREDAEIMKKDWMAGARLGHPKKFVYAVKQREV